MPVNRRATTWLLAGAYVGTWVVNRALRRVEGASMRPTLEPGELVLVLPAGLLSLRRGDVVVVPDPREPSRRTVKRIAALAGERAPGGGELAAGARQVVVLGDDPEHSTDSRTFGPVAAADITAVVVAGLRPLRWLRPRPAAGQADSAG